MDDQPDVPGCNLAAPDLADRRAAWARVEPAVVARVRTAEGFRVTFRADPGVANAIRLLAGAEGDCCGWATWRVLDRADATVLDVAGPPDGIAGLAAAFGL